jgi:heptosyltransferase-3
MYKKLNPLKTKFFKLVTKSLKNYNVPISVSKFEKQRITKILITRPNHRLGNQLLLSPLIQEIHNQIPNCEIDLLVNGTLSKILYQNYSYVNRVHDLPKKPFKNISTYLRVSFTVIRKKYDIGISGCESSNSGKIFLKLSRCQHKIFDSGSFAVNKPEHIAKYPIYNFIINQNKVKDEYINYPKIDLKLSNQEINIGKKILKKLFKDDKKVIAIFTYATGNKRLTKEWWQPLFMKLKNTFPNHNILEVLPKENVSQINFEATHYYSQDLREIASVIENCQIFIGADSGMMHLSASTNTNTLGLFSVTNPKVYEPYGNSNVAILINEASHSNIIKKAKHIQL